MRSARRTQTLTVTPDGKTLANGLPQGKGEGQGDLTPSAMIVSCPADGQQTGPLGPASLS